MAAGPSGCGCRLHGAMHDLQGVGRCAVRHHTHTGCPSTPPTHQAMLRLPGKHCRFKGSGCRAAGVTLGRPAGVLRQQRAHGQAAGHPGAARGPCALLRSVWAGADAPGHRHLSAPEGPGQPGAAWHSWDGCEAGLHGARPAPHTADLVELRWPEPFLGFCLALALLS